jgi:hypothetical protein
MKKTLTACALALALLLPSAQALAWNNKGHMTVAYIAYANLTPAVRAKVDEMLSRHPDHDNIASLKYSKCTGQPAGVEYRRCIFINAATWPDFIRNDPRFYDDTDPKATPTKQLNGFPDMKVHKPWHFKDIPFNPDNSPVTQPDPVNAQAEIHDFRSAVAAPGLDLSRKAYYLSWLLHITGDVHQPLHCVTRFTKSLSPPKHPEGDRGGNGFLINPYPMPESQYPAENLHSFWDNVLGTYTDLASIQALASAAVKAQPKPAPLDLNEAAWVNESFALASTYAYSLSPCPGSQGRACATPTYFSASQATARRRVALAGYRLAAVLNAALK